VGTAKDNNERLAVLETEVKTVIKDMANLKTSIDALHGKFDSFAILVSSSYVAKDTFEEWKKNRWYERVLIILCTAIISGLVAFFLRENGV
jgi:hypothetical protein